MKNTNPWEKHILVRFWGGKVNTWRNLITDEMKERGESWEDVVACTLTDEELDAEFDDGLGLIEGKSFTLWTKKRVYFSLDYDCAEYCGSVQRYPWGEAIKPIGSWDED